MEQNTNRKSITYKDGKLITDKLLIYGIWKTFTIFLFLYAYTYYSYVGTQILLFED